MHPLDEARHAGADALVLPAVENHGNARLGQVGRQLTLDPALVLGVAPRVADEAAQFGAAPGGIGLKPEQCLLEPGALVGGTPLRREFSRLRPG